MLRPRKVGGRWVLARAGVGGGVAYTAAKHRSQAGRQQQDEAEADERSDEAPAPEPADPIGQIEELSELRAQGILTEEEFTAEKKKLLGI